MTASTLHPNAIGIRRDGSGLVQILPGAAGERLGPRSRWHTRSSAVSPQNRGLPRHLMLRDCVPSPEVRGAMRQHCPRAAAILDDFQAGSITTREAAIKADGEYSAALEQWLVGQHFNGRGAVTRRSDADSVWLHTETVFWLAQVMKQRYAAPSIFNVIPEQVLGTSLKTYGQYTEDESDEGVVLGDTFEPLGTTVGSAERGEIIRKLEFYKTGAAWTDRDLEIEAEIRANGRGPAWSLIDKATGSARRAIDNGRAYIAAFGWLKDRGIAGLLYGSAVADAATEAEFASTDPEANVAALLDLVSDQEAGANFDPEATADTLALDPATFSLLGRQQYSDGVTTFEASALANFMSRAGNIKRIVVASEFRSQGAAQIAKLLGKEAGGDATMAARLSGGIRAEDEQRSCAMVYKDDPEIFSHVVGRQLETMTWPPHRGKHEVVMRESSGGVIFREPLGAKMIYRAADGDGSLT